MHAWRAYAAVVLPLVCLLWGQFRFNDARESLHVGMRHELSRLEQTLQRDARPSERSSAMLESVARMQALGEQLADTAFHTVLYFGLFPLVLGLSLLAAERRAHRPSSGAPTQHADTDTDEQAAEPRRERDAHR